MRTPNDGFDHHKMRDLFAGPDAQWCSFGIVDAGTPDNNSPPVAFDADFGPLVNVTLQPSGLQVICRVMGALAGQGEAEYWPFVEGDEVAVMIPEGNERAGCVIIGRLNQALDKWPTTVAGLDTTQNNVAFTRTRTPYVFETAASWMVRSAGTGAFISMTSDGAITISDAQNAFLAFNPDFIGLQDSTGAVLMQIDLQDGNAVVQAGASRLLVDPSASSWLSSGGSISIAGYGVPPLEHAISTEAVVNFTEQVLTALGLAFATISGPATGAALAALLNPGPLKALLLAAIANAATGTVAPYKSAIAAALVLKPGDQTGNFPCVGSPGIAIG